MVVEVSGFEPPASSVRRKRSARLSYTPTRCGTSLSVGRATSPIEDGPHRICSFHESSRRLSRSWTTVVVRSARDRSVRERATSVVRLKP